MHGRPEIDRIQESILYPEIITIEENENGLDLIWKDARLNISQYFSIYLIDNNPFSHPDYIKTVLFKIKSEIIRFSKDCNDTHEERVRILNALKVQLIDRVREDFCLCVQTLVIKKDLKSIITALVFLQQSVLVAYELDNRSIDITNVLSNFLTFNAEFRKWKLCISPQGKLKNIYTEDCVNSVISPKTPPCEYLERIFTPLQKIDTISEPTLGMKNPFHNLFSGELNDTSIKDLWKCIHNESFKTEANKLCREMKRGLLFEDNGFQVPNGYADQKEVFMYYYNYFSYIATCFDYRQYRQFYSALWNVSGEEAKFNFIHESKQKEEMFIIERLINDRDVAVSWSLAAFTQFKMDVTQNEKEKFHDLLKRNIQKLDQKNVALEFGPPVTSGHNLLSPPSVEIDNYFRYCLNYVEDSISAFKTLLKEKRNELPLEEFQAFLKELLVGLELAELEDELSDIEWEDINPEKRKIINNYNHIIKLSESDDDKVVKEGGVSTFSDTNDQCDTVSDEQVFRNECPFEDIKNSWVILKSSSKVEYPQRKEIISEFKSLGAKYPTGKRGNKEITEETGKPLRQSLFDLGIDLLLKKVKGITKRDIADALGRHKDYLSR